MLNSSLFWKIYISFVALVLLTAVTIGLLSTRSIEQNGLRQAEQQLTIYSNLLKDDSTAEVLQNSDLSVLQERVSYLSRKLTARFTVMRGDGTVIADSDEDPAKMDNHATRPEVVMALEKGVGTSTRFSNTVKKRMMYVALAVKSEGGTVGYVRSAYPLSDVDTQLAEARNTFVSGAVVGLILALFAGFVLARQIAHPLSRMTKLADSIAKGNYDQHVTLGGSDEMGKLATALNTMATQIERDIAKRSAAEAALQRAGDELERRVEERTSQLSQAVVMLEEQAAERKRAEEALQQSEQMLSLVMDNIPQFIFWKNLDSVYLGCNRNFAEAVGFDNPAQIVGKTDFDMPWKPGKAEAYRESDRRLIETQLPENHTVEMQQWLNRGEIWVDKNKVPLRDHKGEVIGVLGTYEDITEQRQIEDEREMLEAQLLQAQKMESIGTLAGGVAHDFNNLLTVISGNLQLALRTVEVGSKVERRLFEMQQATDRAAALTQQLLAFGRRQHLERRNVDLNETLVDFSQMLERLIGENVRVQLQVEPNVPAVFADRGQIEQIVMNLAVNARDAMPDGGKLIIETHSVMLDESICRLYTSAKPGRYVCLMVSDTGQGMDAETRARIFEPFFTTKGVGKGTGLGLSTVYGIVKQHEGIVQVYSEPGHGTTFKVYLPAASDAAATVESSVSENFLPVGGEETILIAEDEPALRELARDLLESLGYRVLAARDGAEAVEIYEQSKSLIQLLLLDVMMPRVSGFEAYARISQSDSGVPAIFVTGFSAEAVRNPFALNDKTILIQKPYSVDNIGRKVREVLDKRKSERLLESSALAA